MNKMLIEIAYDDREHAEILLEQLTLHTDVHLIRKRLMLGDYQINNWLIERKTLPDLALSLCNGRLFSQIYRLSESSCNTALLIEGTTRDIASYDITRESLIGAICSISLSFNMPILRSLSQTESAKILYFCATQLYSREAGLKLDGRKPKRKKNRQLFILQSLPQIGPKLAKRLLSHFNNIEAVFTATEEELINVEGIGRDKARKIREILTQ
ncbi:multidrug MFS transporter [Shewanella eurypsychrophilus]|uniref:Multidrug MFS transporter n=1 Tax=Shewanella eurypsychrophilus TaxID=2593656 RepID=A0ABX6VC76_9GAMM|nr:multidrug MFS transporter [Shewanella sp. YLB-09]QFU25147.1 multidrug MFS transporter [Shewanella sp. YLB-09]QPG60297.1 multidrug MFS transporter [Shewanella eurypsychrophilus]